MREDNGIFAYYAIKNKETWAAGINETTNAQINNDAQNKLMDAFWRFIAKNAS